MKILAIDPGLRNLAWCMLNDGNIEEVSRADIFEGASVAVATCFECISKWCDDHQHLFDSADIVVIEKQFMDNKMRLSACLSTVQSVLQCRSYKKHILVHAGTIKKIYRTHRGTHKLNKQAAVEKATEISPYFRERAGKLDDMCDAFLLAYYVHTHFSLSVVRRISNPTVNNTTTNERQSGEEGCSSPWQVAGPRTGHRVCTPVH